MPDIPEDDSSRARREEILRFFQERDAQRNKQDLGFEHVDPSKFGRIELIEFLKAHEMPLGELGDPQSKRILIIAGSERFIEQVRELLPERDKFKIETAVNGFYAGVQAESIHPQVIVIDFDLGFSEASMIALNLRKSTTYEATLIIGMANEPNQTSAEAIAYGFHEIALKPVDVAQLCQRIRAIFGQTE